MSNLTLVVDNKANIKHQVLQNLMFHGGKPVSMFCAIRNVEDTGAAIDALQSLLRDDLIERKEIGIHRLVLYRYRSEMGFFRRTPKSISGKLRS